ncbi:hypothetical protein [Pseudorhodoplanes sinuspersici]|uniref:Uncharacterized protein n=1 Tax=Pseudorhodoplanes sinuspersici TaxID=1235591 RepID=A0A1W6ZY47_9HYPH|nr:hypothetical protein [Pseudorhodoplanes sinuspersici]ARQ02208.1 hypothetical protein CAK95_26255 [Pseudorhodoplanes sinuspersici]RKE74028.1 hypothetical protein DFP91_1927 [Pseudorhodoplanes sinuspersici]
MNIIIALVAGLIGGAAGIFAGIGVGLLLVDALAISSFEGGSGYFTLLIGLIGGVIGFFTATILTLRYRGRYRGFGAIAGRTALIVIVLGILTTIGVQIRLATVEHFSGASPRMLFEIRLPEGAPVPNRNDINIELHAGSQRVGPQLDEQWIWHDGNRPVLSGFTPLYTRTSSRMLIVSLPETPRLLFSIKLASTPRPAKFYGDWQRVDYLDDGKADSQPRKPNKNENYEIRYYVAE